MAFAKHIKRLEKLRNEQGRYMIDELNAAESRKKALEKEISDLEAQKSLLDAEERILTAQYNTKLCEISLQQISGNVMVYLE